MSDAPKQTNTTVAMGKPGSAERRRYEAAVDRQYHPCETGLHVCGIDDDAGLPFGPHFTVINLPMAVSVARDAFERARVAFEVPDDEGDVLVDLQIEGSTEDNFFMRRQMTGPLQRSIADVS